MFDPSQRHRPAPMPGEQIVLAGVEGLQDVTGRRTGSHATRHGGCRPIAMDTFSLRMLCSRGGCAWFQASRLIALHHPTNWAAVCLWRRPDEFRASSRIWTACATARSSFDRGLSSLQRCWRPMPVRRAPQRGQRKSGESASFPPVQRERSRVSASHSFVPRD